MSSPSATAQDGVPSSAGTPLRHPHALAALGVAFLAATLGAYGLGSRLTSASAAESKRSRLAAGSLALLHARLEQQALMAALMSSGDALSDEVKKLENEYNMIVGQVQTKTDEFNDLKNKTKDKDSLLKAMVTEEQRLKAIQTAFGKAHAKKVEAETAMRGIGSLPDLKAWQAEWDRESKAALAKIKEAIASLDELKNAEAKWSPKKDTLTPEEKTQMRTELNPKLEKTTAILEEARKMADSTYTSLSDLIKTQSKQLEEAAAAPPP